MAKEVKAPVIALSQARKTTEKRGDKRPTIADLSGTNGKDVDVFLFI